MLILADISNWKLKVEYLTPYDVSKIIQILLNTEYCENT